MREEIALNMLLFRKMAVVLEIAHGVRCLLTSDYVDSFRRIPHLR
jgi:hypothetical protein